MIAEPTHREDLSVKQPFSSRLGALGCSAVLSLALAGCATEDGGLLAAPTLAAPQANDRPPAMFAGQAIAWSELRSRVFELSGGPVLEEIVLERSLQSELAKAAITIDAEAIAREERVALEALSTDPARAAQLLAALRKAQSLGPTRWQALLWRNAALRALAKVTITLTEENIRQSFDAAHGPTRIGRLIVVPDIAAAERARSRLQAGESFAEVAAQVSIDSSAARGGLLAPIARMDPSFPSAFREVLFTLAPGEVSAAVLLDNGYAIVQLREERPGDGVDPSTTRTEDERLARRVLERVEMDRIARVLLSKAKPTVFDDALLDSWQRQSR